ncbi:MAG: single-stranded DNA-binding protein [Bacteroidetes bacterium]|nr:MAG: single-stranded DNA-binding protein [Bacteroidota bacterium]
MKNVNKVILLGNVGQNPEIKELEGKIKVAHFSLATNETYKNNNGELQVNTYWHKIIGWRNLADIIEKYVFKGSLVYIEGKLRTRNYEDKQGIKQYVTEIIADDIIILDESKKI